LKKRCDFPGLFLRRRSAEAVVSSRLAVPPRLEKWSDVVGLPMRRGFVHRCDGFPLSWRVLDRTAF
jgi:hypothetical protein